MVDVCGFLEEEKRPQRDVEYFCKLSRDLEWGKGHDNVSAAAKTVVVNGGRTGRLTSIADKWNEEIHDKQVSASDKQKRKGGECKNPSPDQH